ncbi:MAG TPA: tandem-95 repeat protein, partial [Thermoguttaceae bacterium]|nr:tandem-95 repeat protein [Thermoguttaceae bacterium]
SMSLLDGAVPYGVLTGNHDQADGSVNFNATFPYTRYETEPWYGGHYGTANDNNYQLFSAGGDDYLMLNLGYSPNGTVIAWADSVLKAYPNHKAIITTHSYLSGDGSRNAVGEVIWNSLVVPNSNVHFVLCGHIAAEYTRTDVVNGHNVYQVLVDYQGRPNGGNGWLRTMRFSPDDDKVYVESYSPWLDQYETDTNSQFALDFTMDGFSVIGTSTDVASGSNASMVWSDLSMDEPYEWYATVTDTTERTTAGPTWSFSTSTNQPPVSVGEAYGVDEDATLAVSAPGVLGNDSDPDADPMTAVLVADVSHGLLALAADGSFLYTPDPSFNGPDSFTYAANDGTADGNTVIVTINVNPVESEPPVAADDTAMTDEDVPVNIDVLANDTDPNSDPLTITILDTTNGTAVINENGTPGVSTDDSVDFTPAANFHGTASLTYLVNDGQSDSNAATVTITVNPVNDAPAITGQSGLITPEEVALTVTLSDLTVSDPDNAYPAGFTLAVGDGANYTRSANTITPVTNFNGTLTVPVTVNDGAADSSVFNLSVSVTPVNDAPAVAHPIDDVMADEDAVDSIVDLLGVFDDVDVLTNADSLTFSIAGNDNPSLLSAGVVDNVLTLDYADNQHGTANVRVRATDSAGLWVEDEFLVTVNAVNDLPQVVDPIADVTVDQGTAQTLIDLSGVFDDVDVATGGDFLEFSIAGNDNPDLVATALEGNTLTLTYAAGQNGTANITVRATDQQGESVEDAFLVTVNASISDDRAVGESTTYGSVVSGDLTATRASDDGYEVLREELYAANKRSRLEHAWQFDVTGGSSVTFYVEAHHDSSVEDFAFAYSTDGGMIWTTMVTITGASDSYQTYPLPASTSGTVLIRATDTDPASKEAVQDSLYVDDMFIRCEGQGGLPVVSIAATDAAASEAGLDPGTFTVSRTGDTGGDLVVYYALNGTATAGADYQPLAGSVTIPDGSSSATITITPIDDDLAEGTETVHLMLAPDAAYTIGSPAADAVTIFDDDLQADDYAVGEQTSLGTVTVGDFNATHGSDDSYEAIQEAASGGLRSRLEHVWTFDVAGGSNVTFHVEAFHDAAVDNFDFEYSLDGVNWTHMLTVTKTADDDQYQTYQLSNMPGGTVFVRVIDTDSSKKESSLDTVYVDDMFFRMG